MAKRNSLFKRMVEILEEDHEVASEDAKKLSKQALIENRQRNNNGKGQSSAGGQGGGKTKPITILEDACEGIDPGCDGEVAFRTITGQCNNLEDPYWGAMSTAFLREIEVGEYNPKTEFIVTGDAADDNSGDD